MQILQIDLHIHLSSYFLKDLVRESDKRLKHVPFADFQNLTDSPSTLYW